MGKLGLRISYSWHAGKGEAKRKRERERVRVRVRATAPSPKSAFLTMELFLGGPTLSVAFFAGETTKGCEGPSVDQLRDTPAEEVETTKYQRLAEVELLAWVVWWFGFGLGVV